MDDSIPDARWLRAVVGRSVLLGLGLGVATIAGSSFVLAVAASGTLSTSVLIATILLSFAVGLWAGAPDASREVLPLRDRWLSAAAAAAVAGAFSTSTLLFQQLYPGPWWRMGGLLIAVALPLYTIGLLVPILLAWSERWLGRVEDEEVEWGGLGPIVIGTLGGAALGALLTGLVLLPRLSPGYLLVGVAIAFLIPNLIADPAGAPARETDLYQTVTPYGSVRVTEVVYPGERQPERRLYLNGEEESGQLARSGAPTLAYVAAAERWLSDITPAGARYLFLGGGAYTLPRRLVERNSQARITVVELDPEMTRIAGRFFGLRSQHRIRTIHGDARAFLEHDDVEIFDRIYVDVYAGREALPHSLVTREAAAALGSRLAPGGVAAVNLIGNVVGQENRQVWSVVKSFAEVFPNLALYTHLGRDFVERQNLLLAASPDPERTFPAFAGGFERWPREEWPDVEGAIVLSDLRLPQESRAQTPAPTAREAS